MKKLLLTLSSIIAFNFANAQCNELFISEYVEGTGNDKALEIYNPTNSAINLSSYRIERFSNGSSSSSSGGVLNLSGTVAAFDVFVITNGQTVDIANPPSPKCNPALQAMADQLDGSYPAPMYMNGNDAIVLYKNSTIIDIFGKTGDAAMVSGYGWSADFPYDGSAGDIIWSENHTLYRKATVNKGVTSNPSTFIVTTEWDTLTKDTWTGLGQHVCDCAVGINETDHAVSVVVYPNPTENMQFVISSSERINAVEVYDIIGEKVINKSGNGNDTRMTITTDGLAKGIYFARISFDNKKYNIVKFTIN